MGPRLYGGGVRTLRRRTLWRNFTYLRLYGGFLKLLNADSAAELEKYGLYGGVLVKHIAYGLWPLINFIYLYFYK